MKLTEFDYPQIYCDMDGVLADFKKGAEKATGVPIKQWMSVSYTHLTLPTN